MQRITRRIVRKLYDWSPVPVYERPMVHWLGRYNRRPWYTGKRSWPHIVVSSSQPLYRKAAVVLHEIGHHQCAETSCVCRCTENHALNESHAMVYGLCRCLDHGLVRSHRWSVEFILGVLNHPDDYDGIYLTAAKKATRRKEWDRHLQIVTEGARSSLISPLPVVACPVDPEKAQWTRRTRLGGQGLLDSL